MKRVKKSQKKASSSQIVERRKTPREKGAYVYSPSLRKVVVGSLKNIERYDKLIRKLEAKIKREKAKAIKALTD